MSLSLNAIDEEIIYDTNIDYYIDLHKFSGELVFSFRLPELLFHISDCYCVDVDAGVFEIGCLEPERKMIIAGTRNWITHKEPNGETNFSKAEVFTSMVVAIEIKKEELNSVIALFSQREDDLKETAISLIQSALEIVLYRYNEKAGGQSFLTPSYNLADRLEMAFYLNYIEKRYRRCYCRFYDFVLTHESETPISTRCFNEQVENWRYFFNKSKFELLNKKYVDSIISAAISIEAFSWSILTNEIVEEERIKEFASEDDEEGLSRFLSATKLYKKIIDTGWLTSSLSKTKINEHIQKVLNPRNDIMHGKKSVIGSWRIVAEEVNQHLKELYVSFGVDISPVRFLEEGLQNNEIGPYRKYVLKTNSGECDPQELYELSKTIAKDYPDFELPKLNIIKSLIMQSRIEEALEKTEVLMSITRNPSAVAVEIWKCMPKDHYEQIDSIIDMVDDKDERICAIQGLECLRRYNAAGQSDKELLIKGLNCLKQSNRLNTKYVLASILACEILKELGSDERYEYYRFFAEGISIDYGYSLTCAEYAMSKNDYNSTLKYLQLFVKRFSTYHYSGMKIDFYKINYDLDYVVNEAERVFEYLGKTDVDKNALAELVSVFNSSKTKPLSSTVNIYNINGFAKGKMPQGNIIIGQPLDIVCGSYVIR